MFFIPAHFLISQFRQPGNNLSSFAWQPSQSVISSSPKVHPILAGAKIGYRLPQCFLPGFILFKCCQNKPDRFRILSRSKRLLFPFLVGL